VALNSQNMLDPGDCFFGITASIEARPDVVSRFGQRVTLEWMGHVPNVGCPQLEWLIAPGWISVGQSGQLDVNTGDDAYYYLVVAAHERKWSRTVAQVYIDRVYREPPDRP
jgi:hypothetical protein